MEFYDFEPANFSDYRDFLRTRFEKLKKKSKALSLHNVARKSGISKSHLQFLFTNKRHLSLDKFPSLSKALKLTSEEEAFVYLLICKNSSQNKHVQTHFEQILGRIRHQSFKSEKPAPEISKTSYEYLYQDPIAMSLHSLARLKGFREDPEWILKVLPIPDLTLEKIKSTLKDLEEKGALMRDAKGELKPKEFTFWRPDPYGINKFDVYRKGAEAVATFLKNAEVYQPSVYMLMSHAYDETALRKAEKLMIDLHHNLSALSKESVEPTANMFCGNFFMTLARLKNRG